MPMIGFNFEKVVAEKVSPIKGGIQVKNDVSIKNVELQELIIGKKKEDVLKFTFEFSSTYNPNIGLIFIKGHILFTEEPNEVKKIIADWKKKKIIPKDLMTFLLNAVLMRCNIKAFVLAQEVNLPPHLRLPTIKPQSNVNDYVG